MAKSLNAIVLVLAAVLLVPIASYAAGLGTLTVRSALGQPLDAEIEVVALRPGEELQVRLASRDAYSAAGVDFSPALLGARFAIERRDGRTVVRVRTNEPVNDPFLSVLVEVQLPTGRLARQYTVLVDPVEFRRAAAPTPAAPPVAAAPAPAVAPPIVASAPAVTPSIATPAPARAPAQAVAPTPSPAPAPPTAPTVAVAPPAPSAPSVVIAPAPTSTASPVAVAPLHSAPAQPPVPPVTAPPAVVATPAVVAAPAPPIVATPAVVAAPAPQPIAAAPASAPTQPVIAAAPVEPTAQSTAPAVPAPAAAPTGPVAASAPSVQPALVSAAPQAQPPASAPSVPAVATAPVVQPVQTPASASSTAITQQSADPSDTYRIRRGDTLGGIARKLKPEGVTNEQMLVGLYQTNRPAFIRDNINLIRAGATLFIPGREDVLAISAAEAAREVRTHMVAFGRYRETAVSVGLGSARITQAQREVISRRVGVKRSTRAL